MEVRVSLADDIVARVGGAVARLGSGQARIAMSRALNHEGAKGFTQVKRVLVKQTGIKYGLITKAVTDQKSNPGTLTYQIIAHGNETNIALFGAVERKKGVSAAPWATRRIFPHTFFAGGKVFRRLGKARLPIKGVYGPNIAREIVKNESAAAFKLGTSRIADAVVHEVGRLMP
jgi:hypothetical protein